jgi:hypothetical protein
MKFILVVTRPFGAFARGDVIEDAAKTDEIIRGEHKHDVVPVAAPDKMKG